MPWGMRQFSPHVELRLCDPQAEPHETGDDAEDDDDGGGNAKDVSRDDAPAPDALVVEEVVGVPALVGICNVGDGQVAGENEDEPEQMDPRGRSGARDENLEEGKEGVEGVLADVAPGAKGEGEPGAAEKDGPVDDGDEEGEGDDGGVEERVEGLERAREEGEPGPGAGGVAEGVEGGDEEVKGLAPVGEHGEVGKGSPGGSAAAAGFEGAAVADDEEEGGEAVEGLDKVEAGGD